MSVVSFFRYHVRLMVGELPTATQFLTARSVESAIREGEKIFQERWPFYDGFQILDTTRVIYRHTVVIRHLH